MMMPPNTTTNQLHSTSQLQNSSSSSPMEGHLNFEKQPTFHNNNNIGELQEQMSIDHLLQLMNQVGVTIKAGDFSSQLAENIFTLCQQLKAYGQHLEQSHKNDLNKIFVSLRQACCRDNGQLGTPCRLKMMELVELRAMGWRPNYSHTQYYLNRPEQPNKTEPSPSFNPNCKTFVPSTQAVNYCVPPPALPPSQPPGQYMFMPSEPGYFLIPASQAWPGTPLALGGPFVPQSPHLQRQPPLMMEPDWGRQVSALMGGGLSAPNSPLMGALRRPIRPLEPVINSKSNKAQQFREEITIRNADSGKIMGVKGRRVALVEELSGTVISFQKVEPKLKDRVLTITGSTLEAIQQAKLLVEETIRKNVSPTRELCSDGPEQQEREESPNISIQTSRDGTLKLCCADPEVLQAAQLALTDYLKHHNRAEREQRKERRKSMPLQQAIHPIVQQEEEGLNQKNFTGSSPNLNSEEPKKKEPIIHYNREQMLSLQSLGVALKQSVPQEILNDKKTSS